MSDSHSPDPLLPADFQARPADLPDRWAAPSGSGWRAAGLAVLGVLLADVVLVLELPLAAVHGRRSRPRGRLAASSHGLTGALFGGLAGVRRDAVAGVVLDWVDWPLRLLVLPGMVATLAGQSSPDGRPTHRYLPSRAALRSARGPAFARRRARRRKEKPDVGAAGVDRARISTRRCSTTAGSRSRATRVRAPGRRDPRPREADLRRAEGHRMRAGEKRAEVIELGAGQVLEIRP